jgi:hypothetical protein
MKKLRITIRVAALAALTAMAGCSSAPPKPADPVGALTPANLDARAVSELLQLARAGMPRHYSANRGADVHQVLQDWAHTAGLRLDWKVDLQKSVKAELQMNAQLHSQAKGALLTTGVVDEFDIRAAVIALAQQFRGEEAHFIVEFADPFSITASDIKERSTCPEVPAGAIVFGRYCFTQPPVAVQWYVDPGDAFLSAVVERWAKRANLTLNWQSDQDWPVVIKTRKVYEGDLLKALTSATQDLAGQGVALQYAVTDKTLTIQKKESYK